MRRADRLFQIVQLLRSDRVTTAARLATELQVSERTVYRDVQDLVRSGVPVQGEAGVGYALPRHFELPPLMFPPAEIEALALGARMVQGQADPALARAARSALSRIENVLPKALAARLQQTRLFAPDFHVAPAVRERLGELREALDARVVLRLGYATDGGTSRRDVRPLGLFYWGKVWTLVAWCELRGAFRSFRVDRITSLERRARSFADEPGKRLEDFVAAAEAEGERPPEQARAAARTKATTARGRSKAPRDPAERAAWLEFQRLDSIGPASALDLVQLGFRAIDELRGLDPRELYRRMCELSGCRQDPCVEDAFRCAIAQAERPDLPAKWRQWFAWTTLRGEPAGTWPAELRRR